MTQRDVDELVEDIDVEDARRYPSRLRELGDVIALTGAGLAAAVLILTGAVLRRLWR